MAAFSRVALIGFGEVGQTLAADLIKAGAEVSAYDILFDAPDSAPSRAARTIAVRKAQERIRCDRERGADRQRGDGRLRCRRRAQRDIRHPAWRVLRRSQLGFARDQERLRAHRRRRGRPLCRSRGDDADPSEGHRLADAARRRSCGRVPRTRRAARLQREGLLHDARAGRRRQDVPQRHHQGRRGAA